MFAVSCLALLLVIGSALGVVSALVRAHRMAQAAADLAALATARALAAPDQDPCSVGARSAIANGAHLVSCRLDGRDALVVVQVTGPRWLGQAGDLRATARAGP